MNLNQIHLVTRNFIVELNPKGMVMDLRPDPSKPLDYSPSDIVGTKFSNYVSTDLTAKFKKQLLQLKLNKLYKEDFKLVTKKNITEWYKLTFLKRKSNILLYCTEINAYKLQESHEAFKILADKAPIPIIGFEYPSLTLNYSNQSVKKDIGFDYKEIKEFNKWHKLLVFTDKNDKIQKGKERIAYLEQMIKGVFEVGEPLERTLKTKKGQIKRFEINFSTISKNHLYAFFHDITDQTFAKNVLKDNEAKVRAVLENIPAPILSYDLNNKTLFANRRQKEIIGHVLPKIKSIDDFKKFIVTNQDQPNAVKIFLDAVKNLKQSKPDQLINIPDNEFNLNCSDGVQRIYKVRGTIINKVLILIFKDITQVRNALQLLEVSEKNFRALAQNMPTAIGAYDKNEKIIFINNHFTKITGYTIQDIPTLKEWYKKSQPNLKARKDFYTYWVKLLNDYKNGKIIEKPTIIRSIRCKNGNTIYLNFLFSISKDTSYVQAIDVTEQRIAKLELEKINDKLRSLTGSLQTEIEKERKHISREIHDELGQQVTSIKMQVGNLWKKTKTENFEDDYRVILTSIDNAIKTIRNISTKLRPSILDDLGLQAALEWQIKEFMQTTETKCFFTFKINETNLSKEKQLDFFRIVQESFTNIKRHANATKVYVNLSNLKEQICLTIRDNGKGFNTDKQTGSIGISLMKERILAMNGTFNISSTITKGTTIKICIPRLKK